MNVDNPLVFLYEWDFYVHQLRIFLFLPRSQDWPGVLRFLCGGPQVNHMVVSINEGTQSRWFNNGQSENSMDDEMGIPPISGNLHMDLEWDIVGCHGSIIMCIYIYIHYFTLHYITLHCIALHCITLHYITLHYITLHCIALHYITLHQYIHTYIHNHTYIYIHVHTHEKEERLMDANLIEDAGLAAAAAMATLNDQVAEDPAWSQVLTGLRDRNLELCLDGPWSQLTS